MFARAYKIKGKLQVIYERNDGSKVRYSGGDPAWRNNNPGNIKSSPFAREHGAINSKKEAFAIFPSYDVGRKALCALLKTEKYQRLTIGEALKPYAPKKDGNDPVR